MLRRLAHPQTRARAKAAIAPRRKSKRRAGRETALFGRRAAVVGFGPAGAPTSPTSSPPRITRSSSRRASPMSRKRAFGFFTRHWRSSARTRAGVPSGSALHSGSRSSTRATVAENPSPPNVCRPLRHSYSTHPNDQMSVRRSTTCPSACSGLMYGAVPTIAPGPVASIVCVLDCVASNASPGGNAAFPIPKSNTLTPLPCPSFTSQASGRGGSLRSRGPPRSPPRSDGMPRALP